MRALLFVSAALFAQVPKDVYLLIGQSNMAGRGVIADIDKEPMPGVFMLTKEDKWAPAVEPVHFDRPDRLGVGLSRAFAKTLKDFGAGSNGIGLIPCAMGGSALDEWKPGGKLYTEAVRRAKLATANGARLRGILWHQGESDSQDLSKARSYAARWSAVMQSLRNDVGDAPIVVGGLGELLYTRDKNDYPYSRMINEALASLAVNETNVAYVPSGGLTHKGDILHFDTPSFKEFGRRYAMAFLLLAKP
ncbi:MAG: sialate O-acetylesterase [Acidobacteria bacterium]|nr:sialate O-acetylesterase [Acidobacteriota bacterium]